MIRLWLVRLGKFGEQESHALETGELITGWNLDDLTRAKTREAILPLVEKAYPQEKAGTFRSWTVQLNQFRNEIAEGDLTVTPMKTTGQVAIGRVVGKYFHTEENCPARRVEWLRSDLPRDAIKQDLLYSLGASQTVCEISRNDAVERFESIAKTGEDPGPSRSVVRSGDPLVGQENSEVEAGSVDFGLNARDQIERQIASIFMGHAFTQLISEILRAQGYQTRVSPPGSDRGVDILAGQGALGFDSPRLVVQVKSGDVVADQTTLQSLIGCVQDTHADQGLLVSWSGFTGHVRQRTNDLYFRVRLWGRDEIMAALFSTYDKLPEEIRAELPLRRIWALVPEDTGTA